MGHGDKICSPWRTPSFAAFCQLMDEEEEEEEERADPFDMAVVRRQNRSHGPATRLAMFPSVYDAFGSFVFRKDSSDFGASAFVPHPENIKSWDFEDEALIPDLSDDAADNTSQVGPSFQQRPDPGLDQRFEPTVSIKPLSSPTLSVNRWRSRSIYMPVDDNSKKEMTGIPEYKTPRKNEILSLRTWRANSPQPFYSSPASTLTTSTPPEQPRTAAVSRSKQYITPQQSTPPDSTSTTSPPPRPARRNVSIQGSHHEQQDQLLPAQAPLSSPDSTTAIPSQHNVSNKAATIANRIRAEQLRITARFGPHILQRFIPSRAVQEQALAQAQARNAPTAFSQPHTSSAVLSPLSKPSTSTSTTPYHASAPIPPSQNTALWLLNLPTTTTYATLLSPSTIRGGKIFLCLLHPATPPHDTLAAKLVFFTRAAAAAFLARAESRDGVWVEGRRIRAVWNRILYAPWGDGDGDGDGIGIGRPGRDRRAEMSRVIVIRGREEVMSVQFFEGFFSERFCFQVEGVWEGEVSGEARRGREGWREQVWRFASLRAQAESAKMAVERELGGIFEVEYAVDPCDVPW